MNKARVPVRVSKRKREAKTRSSREGLYAGRGPCTRVPHSAVSIQAEFGAEKAFYGKHQSAGLHQVLTGEHGEAPVLHTDSAQCARRRRHMASTAEVLRSALKGTRTHCLANLGTRYC